MQKTLVTAKTRHTSLDRHPIGFAVFAAVVGMLAIVLVSLV